MCFPKWRLQQQLTYTRAAFSERHRDPIQCVIMIAHLSFNMIPPSMTHNIFYRFCIISWWQAFIQILQLIIMSESINPRLFQSWFMKTLKIRRLTHGFRFTFHTCFIIVFGKLEGSSNNFATELRNTTEQLHTYKTKILERSSPASIPLTSSIKYPSRG